MLEHLKNLNRDLQLDQIRDYFPQPRENKNLFHENQRSILKKRKDRKRDKSNESKSRRFSLGK